MQVILQKTVSSLGLVGDVVDVAPGYYRNYLAPRKMAFLANPKSIKEVQHQKKVIEAKKIKEKGLAESLKAKVEEASLTLTHAAGAGEKLFGSITAQEIVLALKEKGFVVDRKMLQLPNPIKTVGQHVVGLRLHPDVIANVKIEVQKKEVAAEPGADAEKPAKKSKAKKAAAAEGAEEAPAAEAEAPVAE